MSFAASGATIIGAVVSLVGGIMGSNAEAKKRKGIRAINAVNAIRLESQAQATERQTQEDLVSLRQMLTRVVGEQRAGWGASGFSSTSGSALDIMASSITAGLNDQQRRAEAGATAAADLRFAAQVGDLSARAAIEGSQAAGNAALYQGVGQAAGYAIPKIAAYNSANPSTSGPVRLS